MDYYDKGSLVKVPVTFADDDGDAQDPTTVKFQVADPSGNTASYTYGTDDEVVKDSTGNYHLNVDCDESGLWKWHRYSTGTGQASDEGRFYVNASDFD